MIEERIINGGFEADPDPTLGWTANPGEDSLFLIFPPYYHSGTQSAVMVSFVGHCSLTQDVNFTNVNNLTFWYDHYGAGFYVSIDGVLIESYDATGVWTQSTIDVSDYSGTHTLGFGLWFGSEDGDVYVFLDDISALAELNYWYEQPIKKVGLGRMGDKTCKITG